MNKIFIIITSFVVLNSCTPNSNKAVNTSNGSEKETIDESKAKNIDEVKLILLDSRYEKAELLLGIPDVKGRILMGHTYYAFYHKKVKGDSGNIMNLLLLIDGNNGLNDRSQIFRIHLVGEEQTVYGVGNNYQNLNFSGGKLKSNSMDFTAVSGNTEWHRIH